MVLETFTNTVRKQGGGRKAGFKVSFHTALMLEMKRRGAGSHWLLDVIRGGIRRYDDEQPTITSYLTGRRKGLEEMWGMLRNWSADARDIFI